MGGCGQNISGAIKNNLAQADLPENILVISDMEFDQAAGYGRGISSSNCETVMEGIAKVWAAAGYIMPKLIYWNVDARQNNIPMLGAKNVSFVSGFSPSIFDSIVTGKTGYELMKEKLDSPRYSVIH